jgi:UDP-N-acetylmuramate--alanine ligase
MILNKPYFFCGIGGSGMLPLALILRGHGAEVSGSDRALDQGRTAAKFEFLKKSGIALYPQDGSGVSGVNQTLVTSAAVEDTVPDVVAARKLGAPLMTRAELLAQLFNAAPLGIGVAGTSGKSTVTGMIGWMLTELGRDPTIMNGAVMKNFVSADAPFASARVGKSDLFVSEVDESDGSIARYTPHIAAVNNISLDHKTMDELRALFRDFVAKSRVAILNLDNAETAALIPHAARAVTYSLWNGGGDLRAANLSPAADGIAFDIVSSGDVRALHVQLQAPGEHNVYNALATLGVARALDIPLHDAADALSRFNGIRRRLEVVGTANGITVIDDFAHNPDKIAATLATLHAFPGRLLILFQPHGFGPLKKMKAEFIAAFARDLASDDILLMPEPVYYGGTTERSITSEDIVAGVREGGRTALAFATRTECGEKLLQLAQPGDRIAIMGARDDTLATFASELLVALGQEKLG